MSRALTGALAIGISLGGVLFAAGVADAGGFALKERSARAQGLSFAGVTAGSGGLASIGFNPAALGVLDSGGAVAGGLSLIKPTADGEVSIGGLPTGESVSAGGLGGTANFYAGYRFDRRLALGLAVFSPFGLSGKYPAGWAGRGDALTSNLVSLTFAPTVAWEPVDGLTLAASFDVLYIDARLTSALVNLDGNQTTAGFSVGALWQPFDGTSIGLAYRHGYELELSGTAQGPATRNFPLPVTATAQVPSTISLGVTQDISDRLRVMGEVQWQDWSVFDRIDVNIASPLGTTAFSDPQNFRDAFFVALGGEYDVTDRLTLRAGTAWDQTPTQDSIPAIGFFGRSARIPDEDRVWLSIGASYTVGDAVTLDAGYSYIFALEDPVVALRTVPGASVSYTATAHVFSVGASFRF